jgi:hypothetical protein
MIRTIKTISLALLFALGIFIGFIGGFAISKKESSKSFPLCVSSGNDEGNGSSSSGNRCRQKR